MAGTMPMKADAENWGGLQTQAIGSVTMVIGDAYVLASSGKRPLETGDQVFSDEVVQTSDGAQIHITFNDQTWLNMGSGSSLALDSEVYDADAATGEPSENSVDTVDGATDVETLQEALAAGDDPSTLAPTAAGNVAEEGGHDAVFVERTGDQTEIDMTALDTDALEAVLSEAPKVDDLLFNEKPEACDSADPESPCYDPGSESLALTIDPPSGNELI